MATSLESHGCDGFPTQIRDAPPANYIFKIKSFNLVHRNNVEKYETNDFEAEGHKWKLIVYPNGNREENVDDHISLYLAIPDSSNLKLGWAINAIFKFFVYDQIRNQYLGMQGGTRRFSAMRSQWGIPKFMSLKAFNEPSTGYLVDDCCVFGVEIFVNESCEAAGECLMLREPKAYKHQWLITNFSTLGEKCYSQVFTAGSENKWKILLFPQGHKSSRGSNVSMYLFLVDADKLPRAQKVLAGYSLSIKDWCGGVLKRLEGKKGLGANALACGWQSFMPLDALRGLLKQDSFVIEAEVTELGAVDELS